MIYIKRLNYYTTNGIEKFIKIFISKKCIFLLLINYAMNSKLENFHIFYFLI